MKRLLYSVAVLMLISIPAFKGSESGTLSESGVKRLRNFCLSAGITAR